MTTLRARIDLNARAHGNITYCSYEDIDSVLPAVLTAGAPVEVYEAESGLSGPGEIVALDPERELVYIRVDWRRIR